MIGLAAMEAITVMMRTYGGTQYDELQIAEETGVLTTIEASKGSSMSEYSWMNNLYIAGESTLTFICSNGAANKGIGVQSIIINGRGASVEYNRYITACQETTEVELVTSPTSARKVLVGGQIYILHNEQLFNIQGQRVK